MKSVFNIEDTIAALATPAGMGAIAVVRLSGNKAFEIADSVFQSAKGRLAEFPSHTVHLGKIVDGQKIVDEVLVTLFKTPHSYTGEDVIEISCHGSVFIQQEIMQLLTSRGARLAQPGEFTLRSFLNGKMDLSQSEAVADLISSDSAAAYDLAMKQMRGGYSEEIKQLRQQLIHFASLIELELDFSEEDVQFADRPLLKQLVDRITEHISKLIQSFELGNVIKQGVPVVIAGKPNAGKSTLLNAILNDERAIVSHIAGTTRDTIEEEIVLSGIKFRFIDTAGLRHTTDTIESIGVNRTYEKIRQSPVLIYLFDVNETTATSLEAEINELKKNTVAEKFHLLLVGNKIDKNPNLKISQFENLKMNHQIIFISAKEKMNISTLLDSLLKHIGHEKLSVNNSIVTNVRHIEALQKTNVSLQKVLEGLDKNITGDFLSTDIRNALFHLGEITGEVTTDDLLQNIFSKFCIGK